MRRSLLAVSLVAVLACGDDPPTGPGAGARLSVEEQVAIEAALNTMVLKLQATGQPADGELADWTRIAARLIRRQGYRGALVVSHHAPVARTDTMHAVAMVITLGSGDARTQLHYLLAWEGLDVNAFTLRQALAVLLNGNGEVRGVFPLAGTSHSPTARYLDLRGDRGPFAVSAGSLAVDGGRFGSACPETPNQPGFRCETGRQTVAGEISAVWAEHGETMAASWEAAAVPTFRLTVE